MMERRKVEITVKSCKDLKNFNFFQKMSVFTEVWIGDDKKNKQRTLSDHDGDRNPEWRQKLVFDLAGTLQYVEEVAVEFEIRREGIGDTFLGWVRVPMKELLLQDHNDGVDQRHVSYQVKGKSGEGVGILNFSYKIHRKHRASSDPPPNSKLETIQMAAGAPSAPPLPVGVESELPAALAYPTIAPSPPAWQYPTTAAAQYPAMQVSQYTPASVYPPPATVAITETPYPPPVYPPPPVWSTQPMMYTYPPPPRPQAGMFPPGGGFPPPPPQEGMYPPAPRPIWYPPGPAPGPYPPLLPPGYPVRPPDPYYQYHGGPWRPY